MKILTVTADDKEQIKMVCKLAKLCGYTIYYDFPYLHMKRYGNLIQSANVISATKTYLPKDSFEFYESYSAIANRSIPAIRIKRIRLT